MGEDFIHDRTVEGVNDAVEFADVVEPCASARADVAVGDETERQKVRIILSCVKMLRKEAALRAAERHVYGPIGIWIRASVCVPRTIGEKSRLHS